ncbi:hypothetical protein XENORESO_012836 [Xenotaenia resolanae]|uniref:Uncharacterized protein n=1 Tax=Xenotaenia resolanae TaxID=208358 RepID=A0ABV0X2L2_9TELE
MQNPLWISGRETSTQTDPEKTAGGLSGFKGDIQAAEQIVQDCLGSITGAACQKIVYCWSYPCPLTSGPLSCFLFHAPSFGRLPNISLQPLTKSDITPKPNQSRISSSLLFCPPLGANSNISNDTCKENCPFGKTTKPLHCCAFVASASQYQHSLCQPYISESPNFSPLELCE